MESIKGGSVRGEAQARVQDQDPGGRGLWSVRGGRGRRQDPPLLRLRGDRRAGGAHGEHLRAHEGPGKPRLLNIKTGCAIRPKR